MKLAIQICSEDEWKHTKSILGVKKSELRQDLLMEWFVRSLGKKKYIWYGSGATKTRAAAACQKAIDKWRPDAIVNLGTCGGVSRDIQKLDIVLANKTFQYDVIQRFGKPSVRFVRGLITKLDTSWADLSMVSERLRTGTIASADQDLWGGSRRKLQKKGILAADWESASIAKVCELNKIKCLILRGVTDIPDDRQASDFENNTPIVMESLFEILPQIRFL
ncbi:MAG: hypothetical protein A2162_07340 [Deltaproteobacteria bacterium RBG_13_52_11b]|nr:MAG: hypothetical protein A2162_07340 [Deltaproteobacteria bacterium RBG_13_52_11b]